METLQRPKTLNIMSTKYKVLYFEHVNLDDRDPTARYDGFIDPDAGEIRINAKGGRPEAEVFKTLLHEVLEGLSMELNLCLREEENHDDLDTLSVALLDFLVRNKWIRLT